MTFTWVLLHVAAAVALAGICCRLAAMYRHGESMACRVQWHAWVLAHVTVASGLVALLFQLPDLAMLLVVVGLSMYFGVRWHRRAGDT